MVVATYIHTHFWPERGGKSLRNGGSYIYTHTFGLKEEASLSETVVATYIHTHFWPEREGKSLRNGGSYIYTHTHLA
jgi:hypothetical protein